MSSSTSPDSYVFGPAAKQLTKAIEKFNKENQG